PQTNPGVVVDSFRFPYIECNSAGANFKNGTPETMGNSPNVDTTQTPPAVAYSSDRLQPYRGGHAVPLAGVVAGTLDSSMAPYAPGTAYGFSEQAQPSAGNNPAYPPPAASNTAPNFYPVYTTPNGNPIDAL